MHTKKINITDKLAEISDYWNPRIIGELNGQYVKLAKIKGEFLWHKHENEDELFLVIKGKLQIEFRNKVVTAKENEIIIVPKGIEHRPIAKEEVSIMLFEPCTTLNTGNQENEFTRINLDRL